MKKFRRFAGIISLFFMICFSSCSQTEENQGDIDTYCDSIEKLTDIQTIRKALGGVALEYFTSDSHTVKIVEKATGYRYISSKVTYYFRDNHPVFIAADIETSGEDGKTLTVELQKIYFEQNRMIRQLKSSQTFNADSLYSGSTDPVKTASDIRMHADFREVQPDSRFEQTLMQAIGKYFDVKERKYEDPALNELYSPFL